MKLRKAGKTKQERKGSINEAAVEGWLGDEKHVPSVLFSFLI
jgi:hypothetical protein